MPTIETHMKTLEILTKQNQPKVVLFIDYSPNETHPYHAPKW